MESGVAGTLDPETAKSLANAFKEGVKLLPQILEHVPELLKKFDEVLEKEAEKRVDKKLQEEKEKMEEKRAEQKPTDALETPENKGKVIGLSPDQNNNGKVNNTESSLGRAA